MKTGSQRQLILLAPRALLVVGLILIVSALLDYTILIFPPNFLDRQWQLSFVTQFVDRGIIPLVGIVLLFTGLWASTQISDRSGANFFKVPLALPALILSCLLGLIFLLLAPLHINNSLQERTETLTRITEEANTASTQLEQNITNQVAQEKARINTLLQNQAQLQQAIKNGQISQAQAVLLQQFQTEPGSLEAYLEKESKEVRARATEELQKQKQEAEEQAKAAGLKSGIRTGLNGLLLALGYSLVGWTGLKELRR